jgi:spore germination protein
MRKFSLCIVLLLIFIPLGCRINRPGVGGFYMNDPGGFNSLPSLTAHSKIIDKIYPLWYHVRPDGSLQEEPNLAAIAKARENKIKILPLINVVPNQDSVLLEKRARDNAIANIVRIVKTKNYDGVNVDFEFIPTTDNKDFSVDRDKMTLFVQILNNQLKKIKKETHMSVLPHVNVPIEMSGIYDYGALARFVNKVTIMCYDFRQEGSPPGPIAPFGWVEQNIITAIKQGFKPSQICLGVATYGYDWPVGRPGGFTKPSSEILRDAAVRGYQVKWSDQYQEPYYVYWDAYGTEREIWFENYATLQTKINLVKKYKLSGICIWRLGFEDSKFWQTIEKKLGEKIVLMV